MVSVNNKNRKHGYSPVRLALSGNRETLLEVSDILVYTISAEALVYADSPAAFAPCIVVYADLAAAFEQCMYVRSLRGKHHPDL